MPDNTKVVEEVGVLNAELDEYKDLNVVMGAAHQLYVDNYNDIRNKPSVNGVEVQGDKTGTDYGLLNAADEMNVGDMVDLASLAWGNQTL